MAIGAQGTALPSTGVGNLPAASFGPANQPGVSSPMPTMLPTMQPGQMPAAPHGSVMIPGGTMNPTNQQAPNQQPNPFANMPPMQGIPPGAISKPGQPGGVSNIVQQMLSQLHPQATQALRAVPRDTMMQLHRAGLIHPQLMQHLYGNQQ